MKPLYAALSPDGRLLGLEDTAREATQLIEAQVGGPIMVQELPAEAHANPIAAERMPELSEKHAQLPRLSQLDVMGLTLEDAHARLLPYFKGLVTLGREVTGYNTPSGMISSWIGQNYKTEKPSQDPGRPAEMMGLTLVPASHVRMASLGEGPYQNLFEPGDKDNAPELKAMKRKMLARWKDEAPSRLNQKFTWCQGSSKECRDSCLVFAGQNASTRYNTYRKVAQSMALLNQPAAFMRILVEAISKWMDDCTFYLRPDRKMEIAPFFRMNMLSDIPWERLVPWFFDYFAGRGGENGKQLQFYDYTKVPGRRGMPGFPRNYDLTFSLSGEAANIEYAKEEIAKYNSRLAVVFLGHKRKGEHEWTTLLGRGEEYQRDLPLPKKFWGRPVFDGDRSDVRQHDPAGCVVGLRWKIPSGKRSGADPDYDDMSFVTPVYVESADQPSLLTKPNPGDDLVLISPVTYASQPVEHDATQPL